MTAVHVPASTPGFTAGRLPVNPIVAPHMSATIGTNINGPSLIRVPDWVPAPLGRFYLYFAHHAGDSIRLAYSDSVSGPWTIHEPGTLQVRQTRFGRWAYKRHIASPDVHIDADNRRIVMFYHGGYIWRRPHQATALATSSDGLSFSDTGRFLGLPYWRLFFWKGCYYAVAMPGRLYRSKQLTGDFESGPQLPIERMRHCAVWVQDDWLYLFYTRVGDAPERIILTTVQMNEDWNRWQCIRQQILLVPRERYEGGALAVSPSRYGRSDELVRELRDPFVFCDAGRHYLIYAAGGESCLALAQLERQASDRQRVSA